MSHLLWRWSKTAGTAINPAVTNYDLRNAFRHFFFAFFLPCPWVRRIIVMVLCGPSPEVSRLKFFMSVCTFLYVHFFQASWTQRHQSRRGVSCRFARRTHSRALNGLSWLRFRVLHSSRDFSAFSPHVRSIVARTWARYPRRTPIVYTSPFFPLILAVLLPQTFVPWRRSISSSPCNTNFHANDFEPV